MKTGLLIIPMYGLLHVASIDDLTYGEKQATAYIQGYNLQERKEQYEVLEWALENPDFNFKSVSSIFTDLPFSNTQIFLFLKKFHHFVKDYKLNE